MRHAGVVGVQNMYARVLSPEVPEECSEVVLRAERFLFKVQNAVHRKRWSADRHVFDIFALGNEAGQRPVYVTADDSGQGLYRCTPGPRKTGARVEIRLTAREAETKHPLGSQTYRFPIQRIWPRRC
jgi:hypothetical protein